jgi:hypothetical protein
MSTDRANQGDGGRWEGYSDYRQVSGRIAATVDDAVEAYAFLDASATEGTVIQPADARDARTSIMTAAMMLHHEMEREAARGNEDYNEILADWEGENGYIQRMATIQFKQTVPGWLYDFVRQIRKAGWKLGYLQAGRTGRQEPDDPVEAEAEEMF